MNRAVGGGGRPRRRTAKRGTRPRRSPGPHHTVRRGGHRRPCRSHPDRACTCGGGSRCCGFRSPSAAGTVQRGSIDCARAILVWQPQGGVGHVVVAGDGPIEERCSTLEARALLVQHKPQETWNPAICKDLRAQLFGKTPQRRVQFARAVQHHRPIERGPKSVDALLDVLPAVRVSPPHLYDEDPSSLYLLVVVDRCLKHATADSVQAAAPENSEDFLAFVLPCLEIALDLGDPPEAFQQPPRAPAEHHVLVGQRGWPIPLVRPHLEHCSGAVVIRPARGTCHGRRRPLDAGTAATGSTHMGRSQTPRACRARVGTQGPVGNSASGVTAGGDS
mmetsp:Transcript_136781/g.437601  ORF Transcript_136781/g.437601 Transcript_136781/m.437601 type:complete len:333 (+) Transcript_136781:1518-2516(+)